MQTTEASGQIPFVSEVLDAHRRWSFRGHNQWGNIVKLQPTAVRNWLAILVVVALAMTSLIGCGSDDDSGSDASASSSEAESDSGDSSASGSDADSAEDTDTDTDSAEATGEPIIIGINADTTGPGAPYSIPAFETVKDTVDLVNSQGGVLGRPLELIQGNDESDATKTPTVLAQLSERGAVFLLSQVGVATPKELIESTGLPFMTVTSINPFHAMPPDNTYAFAIANPLSQWAPTFCESFAASGVERVGILAEESSTITGLNDILLTAMDGCVEIATTESAPLDASDMTAPITRLRGADVDAVWVTSSGGPFEVLAFNTLAQLMPDVQKFTLASIANEPEIWKLANPGALEGVVGLGSLHEDNEQTTELREFLGGIRGDDFIATAFDAQAFDAVMIVKAAIENAEGDLSPEALVAGLEAIDAYPASFGGPGYTLSFNADKHTAFSGACGIVMVQFDENNTTHPWDVYQPSCDE